MRCSWLVMVAACAYTDLDQPIGVVAHGLSDVDAANLVEGAQCWNLEFGTHYVAGDEAPQQVDAFYDTSTCLTAVAQTQPGTPSSIAVCPQEYWSGVETGVYAGPITPFRVLSHELGHELNIVGHPSDGFAVMRSGTLDFSLMFEPADHEKFAAANPGWRGVSSCKQVIRSVRPFTGGSISHCACDTGTALDVTMPLTLVVAPGQASDALANAASCWNLHYGLSLAVGGDGPGQVAYLDESCEDEQRVRDGDHVLECVAAGLDPMVEIARVLDVDYFPSSDAMVFDASEDRVFADVYPMSKVACVSVVRDASGVCSCAGAARPASLRAPGASASADEGSGS